MDPEGTYLAYLTPEPSAWDGYALIAFSFVSMACLFAPLALLGSGPKGVGARRRWRKTAAIALAMIPLFIVGPEAIAQMYNQSLIYRAAEAGAAVAIGQVPTTTLTEYAYDANGNQIEKKVDGFVVGAYTYDSENRLIQFDPQLGVADIVDYSYDDDGIRNAKSVGGVVTTYTTDKNQAYAQVIEERDAAGDLQVSYTYGHDLISQDRTAGSKSYYHYDGQMSTRYLTDNAAPASVAVTDSYTYSAYGQLTDSLENTPNAYRYTGEQWDDSLDNYYLRARYYDQNTGRFTSRDAFAGFANEPTSLHKYLYAHSSPVDNYDPSGRSIASFMSGVGVLAILTSVLLGAVSGAFAYAREKSFFAAAASFGTTLVISLLAFSFPLLGLGLIAYGLGQIPHNANPAAVAQWDALSAGEAAAMVAVMILVLAIGILAKKRSLSVAQVREILKTDMRQAHENLTIGQSVRGKAAQIKWDAAVARGDVQAQGTLLHAEAAHTVHARGLSNLKVETSYSPEGAIVRYGAKDSIRIDYTLTDDAGTAIMNFDWKPGPDAMSPARLGEYFQRSGAPTELLDYRELLGIE